MVLSQILNPYKQKFCKIRNTDKELAKHLSYKNVKFPVH